VEILAALVRITLGLITANKIGNSYIPDIPRVELNPDIAFNLLSLVVLIKIWFQKPYLNLLALG
jgi:hypothetical protein